FVLAEHFDVVVEKPDEPEPAGGYHEQNHVDVIKLCQQQGRNEDGSDDYQSSHGGRTLLLNLSFEPKIADIFANLLAAEEGDQVFTKRYRNQQRDGCRQTCTERYILK